MAKWTEDPDIRAAFDWFVDIVGADSWSERKDAIKGHIGEIFKPKMLMGDLTSPKSRVVYEGDQFAWYLYLAEAYLCHIEDYEFAQGARVIPLFKILGQHLNLLKLVNGVRERAQRIATSDRRNPDGGLFELLVALIYKRNGMDSVSFVPETPTSPTPDIKVKNSTEEYYVECKRMSKSSDYSLEEREKWLRIAQPLQEYICIRKRPLVVDIVFHVELRSLENNFVRSELISKLEFVCCPCVLIDNEVWTVTVDFVDYKRIDERMSKVDVKLASSSLSELVTGKYEPYRGQRVMCLVDRSGINDTYVSKIHFAAATTWSCDAENAKQAKARDIRRRLAAALKQLPDAKPGIVHIGLESHDGMSIEKERYARIVNTVRQFDARGKDLDWIYCHIFDPRVPPDKNWDFGETVYYFGRNNPLSEPLKRMSVALPDDAEVHDGASWL
ncbi:MAG: hypothetical protein FVQ84_16940 [Planctomycetes bacterium]|nr:hypothetical protein [Planctomycetota bacterium]